MITYGKFKELFNLLDSSRCPEIELYFEDTDNVYMIVKHNDYIDFGRCDSKIRKFSNLDELYIEEVDGVCLKRD